MEEVEYSQRLGIFDGYCHKKEICMGHRVCGRRWSKIGELENRRSRRGPAYNAGYEEIGRWWPAGIYVFKNALTILVSRLERERQWAKYDSLLVIVKDVERIDNDAHGWE